MNFPFHDEAARCQAAQIDWSKRPMRERLRCVRNLKHLFVDQWLELALTVTQDVARPAEEVLGTDILPTADACRFLERNARRILRPHRIPRTDRPLWLFGSRDTVQRRPHGIVGVIGTWNYPIFLNAIQIVQALTAGNGVLWKPSELTPTFAIKLHELFLKAGFPVDLVIRLPATREAGPQLAEAAINHLVFTGSADVGRKLARRLGERLVSSTLELSGCDALIVAADADVPMAAKATWFGTTLNRGQTCMAIRRVFVERSCYAGFLDRLRLLAARTEPQPLMLWPQAEQAERLVRLAVTDGATLLLPGDLPRAENDPPRYPQTFVVDARPEMAICREASFAPIAAVIPFDSLADVVGWQKLCPYGLAASIFMRNRAKALKLAEALDVGMISINDTIAPTAHPATPFGGRGDSGWGSTQGADGLLAMTVPQSISERGGSFRPHYDSADGTDVATAELLKGMLHWCHAKRWRQRWVGLWRMVRAALRCSPGARSATRG